MNIATFSPLGYMGELGNQMFQIAATVGYARKYGKTPIFPAWTCKITGRNYTSEIFKGPIDQSYNQGVPLHNRHTYNDLSYIEIPRMEGNVDLVGYFQSEKYFENCQDEIRNIFSPRDSVKEYIETKYRGILDNDQKVSLHIRTARRSSNDYDVHSSADSNFIKTAKEIFGDKLYVIFTDNPEFTEPLIPADMKYVIVKGEENYIDLFMMTYFNEMVVSSSTFGWWGAWLNQNKDPKIAIMKNWFDPRKEKAYLNNNDIVPDRWIKIDGHFNNRL
jgi:hypothetical protein